VSGPRVFTPAARVGGYERVTGLQQYVADIHLPDVLQVKLVHLDVARARIVSIDTSAALAVPGVRLVMTAADLPQPVPRFGPQFRDRPVLATDETKYHGEPVAAVAAETKDTAQAALEAIEVEYEELAAVFDPVAAMEDRARRLFGLLFHPEVAHSEHGATVLANFLEVYYEGADPSPWKAAWILARAILSAMVNGALIGVVGTVIGVVTGVISALNVDVVVPFLERVFNVQFLSKQIYLITELPSDLQRGDVIAIGVVSLVLSLLATIYPSWRASRINPAEALRYE